MNIALQMEAAIGMPIWQILAITAALVELVAGLLILFNVFTRTAALVLFIYTAVIIFHVHDFWNMAAGPDRTSIVHALKDLSIMGAFLVLVAWPRRPVIAKSAEAQEWDEPAQVQTGGYSVRSS